MYADTFSEKFLYCWNERIIYRKIEAEEADICCLKAARQGGGVIRLRVWYVLVSYFVSPEVVCNLSLSNTQGA